MATVGRRLTSRGNCRVESRCVYLSFACPASCGHRCSNILPTLTSIPSFCTHTHTHTHTFTQHWNAPANVNTDTGNRHTVPVPVLWGYLLLANEWGWQSVSSANHFTNETVKLNFNEKDTHKGSSKEQKKLNEKNDNNIKAKQTDKTLMTGRDRNMTSGELICSTLFGQSSRATHFRRKENGTIWRNNEKSEEKKENVLTHEKVLIKQWAIKQIESKLKGAEETGAMHQMSTGSVGTMVSAPNDIACRESEKTRTLQKLQLGLCLRGRKKAREKKVMHDAIVLGYQKLAH